MFTKVFSLILQRKPLHQYLTQPNLINNLGFGCQQKFMLSHNRHGIAEVLSSYDKGA